MKRSNVIFWLLLGIGLVAVALAAGAPPDDGEPLDPRATGPLGAKALVLTLAELGGQVVVTSDIGESFDTAVLLRDDLTDEQRTALTSWVERGGTLLVADPSSSLHAGDVVGDTQTIFGETTLARGECTIPPMEQLGRVDPTGGVLYDVEEATQSCFTRAGGAFVVADPVGEGWIVATGGAGAFVNARLDSEDNAALAANIVVPREGTRVRVPRARQPGRRRRRQVALGPRAHAGPARARPAPRRVRGVRAVARAPARQARRGGAARRDRRLRARRRGGQPAAEVRASRGGC